MLFRSQFVAYRMETKSEGMGYVSHQLRDLPMAGLCCCRIILDMRRVFHKDKVEGKCKVVSQVKGDLLMYSVLNRRVIFSRGFRRYARLQKL